MNHLLKSMAGTVTAFVRRIFFFDRQERVFTSAKSPEELLEALRPPRGWMGLSRIDHVPRLCGTLRGNEVWLGWWPGHRQPRFPTMFHGRVEPAPEGSRLRGHLAPPLFVRCFFGVFLGFISLFALLTVWTLVFPLWCFLMVWFLAVLFGGGAVDAEEALVDQLQRRCGMPSVIDE